MKAYSSKEQEFIAKAVALQEAQSREIIEAEARCSKRLTSAGSLGFLPYWTSTRIWSMLESECRDIEQKYITLMEELEEEYEGSYR